MKTESMPDSVSFGVLFLLCIATVLMMEARNSNDMNGLTAFRQSVSDPQEAMNSWDTSLVDACTWFHVTCDNEYRVVRLDLMGYNLSGQLPPELGNLDRLQYLNLNDNNLNGAIPPELGKLSNLRRLNLSGNRLSGTIPASLGNLYVLYFFFLNNNLFFGPIPSELGNIPTLKVVDVSNNYLCGPVPSGGSLSYIINTPSYKYENNPRINYSCQ